MNESIEWEWIEDGFLCRARVPWGWIVKASENVFHPDRKGRRLYDQKVPNRKDEERWVELLAVPNHERLSDAML